MKLLGRLLLAIALILSPAMPARATVNSAVNKTIVLGDGVTTSFTFSFIGVAAAYISVILTDGAGNETVLTQGSGATQYQIALNAPVTGAIWGVGGTVTYNPSGTPIPAGSTLTIFRTLPLTQAISLQNQNSLTRLGNGAETGLDLATMQIQQNAETLARTIKAPVVDATPPADLPPIAQRANQGAAFDASGNLVAGVMPSSGVISAAMQPVVSAATLALARTAMGLGGMATEGIGCGLVDDGAGNARLNPAISQLAVNTAIHKADCYRSLITTGPITLTLDRGNTLFNGFGFWVYNTSAGAVTLTPDANDTFQGYSSGQSVNLPPNTQAFISTDAATLSNWTVQYALATAPPMAEGGYSGLVVANNAGAPNTQVDVTAGSLTIPSMLSGARRHSAVSFTINTANVGLNGMDVGTLPASSWVYIWAISNGATVGGLVSTSSTAPTMPTGYTYRYRIGAMLTDSSNHFMRTLQHGNKTIYKVTAGSNTTVLPVLRNIGAAAWTAVSVTSFVPPTASQIKLQLFVGTNNNVDGRVGVVPNNSYPTTLTGPTLMGYSNFSAPGGSPSGTINQIGEMTLESSNIYYGTQNGLAGIALSCYGWTDNL